MLMLLQGKSFFNFRKNRMYLFALLCFTVTLLVSCSKPIESTGKDDSYSPVPVSDAIKKYSDQAKQISGETSNIDFKSCNFEEIGIEKVDEPSIVKTSMSASQAWELLKSCINNIGYNNSDDFLGKVYNVNQISKEYQEAVEKYGNNIPEAVYNNLSTYEPASVSIAQERDDVVFSISNEFFCIIVGQGGILQYDDGRLSRYMNMAIKPSLTVQGPDDSAVIKKYKPDQFNDAEVELADGTIMISDALKLLYDYFSETAATNGYSLKVNEVWEYEAGEKSALWFEIEKSYDKTDNYCGIEFERPRDGSTFGDNSYLITGEKMGASIADHSGVCSFIGADGKNKIMVYDTYDQMYDLYSATCFLKNSLSEHFDYHIENTGLRYVHIEKNSDSEDDYKYRLCWFFSGKDLNENKDMYSYIDVVTGEVYFWIV